MTNALAKRPQGSFISGAIPAIASGVIPGLGQLLNRDSDKAIGVFAVAAITGASFVGGLPLIGGIAGLVYAGTWIYGVADGYVSGRRRK
jgi:hypothetical protein